MKYVRTSKMKAISLEDRPKTLFLDGVHELDAACQRVLLSLLPDGGGAPEDCPEHYLGLSPATSMQFRERDRSRPISTRALLPPQWGYFALARAARSQGRHPRSLECFVMKHANDLRKSTPEINREARKLLFSYDWPGNIRELENVARKIVAVGDADLALTDLRMPRTAVIQANDSRGGRACVRAPQAVYRHSRLRRTQRRGGRKRIDSKGFRADTLESKARRAKPADQLQVVAIQDQRNRRTRADRGKRQGEGLMRISPAILTGGAYFVRGEPDRKPIRNRRRTLAAAGTTATAYASGDRHRLQDRPTRCPPHRRLERA